MATQCIIIIIIVCGNTIYYSIIIIIIVSSNTHTQSIIIIIRSHKKVIAIYLSIYLFLIIIYPNRIRPSINYIIIPSHTNIYNAHIILILPHHSFKNMPFAVTFLSMSKETFNIKTQCYSVLFLYLWYSNYHFKYNL